MKTRCKARGIIALAIILASFASAQADMKLKFVFEMFRHGARGPTKNYYDGGNQSDTFGELVTAGMRQHYYLGQQLRKEYIVDKQFLSPYLNWTEVYVRSDNMNRTLASAIAHFYGMFPIGTGYKIPEGIDQDLLLPPFEGVEFEGRALPALDYFRHVPVTPLSPRAQCHFRHHVHHATFTSCVMPLSPRASCHFHRARCATFTFLPKPGRREDRLLTNAPTFALNQISAKARCPSCISLCPSIALTCSLTMCRTP